MTHGHIPVSSERCWKSENSLGLAAILYLIRALLITVCVWSRLLNCQRQTKNILLSQVNNLKHMTMLDVIYW